MEIPRAKLSSGFQMPMVGLGCWRSPPGEVEGAVKAALTECGVTHLDCAAIYGNEKEIGGALAEVLRPGGSGAGVKREDLFITSKLWNTEHAAARVRPACEKSLRELGLGYLDLYLIHWPFVTYDHGVEKEEGMDEVHFTETWKAMEELVDAGLARSIGLSNFNHAQVDEILSVSRIRPAVLQVESHPYQTQEPLARYCRDNGIVLTAFCPLANPAAPDGMRVFGKEGGWRDLDAMTEPAVVEIARKYRKTGAQVILRWQVQRSVVVIPKSKSPARILENASLFDFELTDAEMAAVANLHQGLRVCGYTGMSEHPLHPWGTKAAEQGVAF